MACKFSIPFSGAAQDVINKAKTTVQRGGGLFEGDTSTGVFEVTAVGSTIKGSYTVAGQSLDIDINSKPFFLPCSTIESFLKNSLGS